MKIPELTLFTPDLTLSSFADMTTQENSVHHQDQDSSTTKNNGIRNPDAVITLLDQGNRLDGFDLQGQTALMWATINGELKMVNHLIKAGADINATDWWGRTALTYALTYNHKKIATLLVEQGADLSI
jgi:ankyrin repeat protein